VRPGGWMSWAASRTTAAGASRLAPLFRSGVNAEGVASYFTHERDTLSFHLGTLAAHDEVFTKARMHRMWGVCSLVLEMPIREACHVALQRQPQGAQPAWRHTRERHKGQPGGATATLQVVSFGADMTDRAPTFDMDLKDLYSSTHQPISYQAANAFFKQDPARSWVSFVEGRGASTATHTWTARCKLALQ
jgi:hypothetical protein